LDGLELNDSSKVLQIGCLVERDILFFFEARHLRFSVIEFSDSREARSSIEVRGVLLTSSLLCEF
jgi:hypothetical protein